MGKMINFIIPSGWKELTQEQFGYVFEMLALNLDMVEVQMMCLMKFVGCRMCWMEGEKMVAVSFKEEEFVVPYEQVMEAVYGLRFLGDIPSYPVHLEVVDGHEAVAVDFQGVAFERYLYCDNLYQGYLATQDEGLLVEMAKVLYECEELKPSKGELIAVFYWFAALKRMFAARFGNFLKPGDSGEGGNIAELLQDSMNAQIRALTKGDITKEKEVLSMDTWRALTELDAQAKESEGNQKTLP